VGLEEPRQGAFITGLVGLAASTGFNALVILMWLITMLRGRNPGSGLREPWLWYSFVALLVSGIMLGLWLLARRRIRRLSVSIRRTSAAACCATTILNAYLFSIFIR
jgi:peptidoglycan biosynthesis protein MviN/MurJ (putative lipid II flippase)